MFIESYKLTLQKQRVISQIAAFLIAVIFLVEIISNFNDLFFAEPQWTEAYNKLLETLSFQSLASFIFGIRFVLLYLEKPKSLFLSQFIWLVGWLLLFGFFVIPMEFPPSDGEIHFHWQFSIYKTYFALIPFFYFLFSPIKQIFTLIFAYFYRK